MDVDGVLWVGHSPLPGVAAWFKFLQAHGIRFVIVSNNSTRRGDSIVKRLDQLGVQVTPKQVLTSADAAALWLPQTMPHVKRVYVVGEEALVTALAEVGLEIVERHAQAVVVGLDRQVTYERLKRAALEIRAGATFIATNADRTLPTDEGLTPGAGSLVAALVAATDVQPIILGKPHRPMFDLALDLLGTPRQETAMLGDRLDTDIEGAAAVGLKTILVLTGVSTQSQAEQSPCKPDFIFPDLPSLQAAWEG